MALTLQATSVSGALKSPLIEEEHNPEDSINIGKSSDVQEIIQDENLRSKRQLRGKERPQTNIAIPFIPGLMWVKEMLTL